MIAVSSQYERGIIVTNDESTTRDHRIPLLESKRCDRALHQRVKDLWRQVIEGGNEMVRILRYFNEKLYNGGVV